MTKKEEKVRYIVKALGFRDVLDQLDIYYDLLEKERPGAKAEYLRWVNCLADSKAISFFDDLTDEI